MTATAALIAVIVIVAYIGAWTFVWYLAIDMEKPDAAIVVAGALVALLVIGVGITAEDYDNSVHCGPGTTYRESSRYDPVTKRVRHDWVCEAR